jgi:DNA-binding beta-propeller fold protein YncE
MKKLIVIVSMVGIAEAASFAGAGTLYATNDSNDFIYRVNPTTGMGTLVGPSGVGLSFCGMAYDTSTGTLYVSDAYDPPVNGLGIIDTTTGAVSLVGGHVNSNNIHGLAYDSLNDVLYGADTMPCGGLAVVDRGTGVSTCIGVFGATAAIYGLAYDPVTDTLFGVDIDSLFTIDRSTGAATLVGAHLMPGPSAVIGLEFDAETGMLYGAKNDRFFTIDPTTGAGTLIADGIGNPNPGGLASVPVQPVFSDGFETGDTGGWNLAAP